MKRPQDDEVVSVREMRCGLVPVVPRGPDGWQKWVYAGERRPAPRPLTRKRHVSGLPTDHPIWEIIRDPGRFAAWYRAKTGRSLPGEPKRRPACLSDEKAPVAEGEG